MKMEKKKNKLEKVIFYFKFIHIYLNLKINFCKCYIIYNQSF